MRFRNGIHSRTPVWTWAMLLVCSALVLPGAKLIWAQEDKPSAAVVPSAESSELPIPHLADFDPTHSQQPVQSKSIQCDVSDLLTAIRGSKPKNETAEELLLAELAPFVVSRMASPQQVVTLKCQSTGRR